MEFVESIEIAIPLVLALALFIRAPARPGNWFLGCFFILVVIGMVLHGLTNAFWYRVVYSSELVYLPLIYMYYAFSAGVKVRLRIRDLAHLLPAAAFFLIFGADTEAGYNALVRSGYGLPTKAILLQELIYLGLCWRILTVHPAPARLKILLAIFFVVWAAGLVDAFGLSRQSSDVFNIVVAIAFMLIGLLSLIDSPFLSSNVPLRKRKSNLVPDPELPAHKEKLQRVMVEGRPYLNSLCTLKKVAGEVGISAHELSEIVNKGFGKNFNDYINDYRISDARAMLATTNSTVLNIAYEVGFNSKSSFYTAFKKTTGMTPVNYRKVNSGKAGEAP